MSREKIERSVPALAAPPRPRDNPLTRSPAGVAGMVFLGVMLLACLGTLPWTMGSTSVPGSQGGTIERYNAGDPKAGRLPPFWWPPDADAAARLNLLVDPAVVESIAATGGLTRAESLSPDSPVTHEVRKHWPRYLLGTDVLGRSLLIRCLTGGGISLGIGIAAALLSVLIGTMYGAVSAYAGGRTDAVMMRIVDVLYGLPYVLLVVLLAVASDGLLDEYLNRNHARAAWIRAQAEEVARERGLPATRAGAETLLDRDPDLRAELETKAEEQPRLRRREISERARTAFDLGTLLVAIGGVSWLTMARVVRGQVLSLKAQPFMESARAIGVPWTGQFFRHLLPNLMGPIIVYATLTVPQAILQESFLSFLGIGVKPPLPSWGNLAADALSELNVYKSHWWLLVFPCILLGSTLLALNFVGEGLREAFDPRRARR